MKTNAVESPSLDLLIDALATYRLVKLVRDDKITEKFRDKIYEKYGDPSDGHLIAYLSQCAWCLSIYAGAAVGVGRIISPGLWKVAARSLALSALTGMLVEREDSLKGGF